MLLSERSEGITTLSEYYYNYIHKLAKQQHSKGATIVRSIIEQYCDTLEANKED